MQQQFPVYADSHPIPQRRGDVEEFTPQIQFQQQETDIANLLLNMIDRERDIEEMRIILAQNERFETCEAFRTIDRDEHGYISINDLRAFFAKYNVFVQEQDCEFFMFECTRPKGQSTLSFKNFLALTLPRHNFELRKQCVERKKYHRKHEDSHLPFFLKEQLARLFELELLYLREIEAMKMDLINSYNWNLREAFYVVSQQRDTEFINKETIYNFLARLSDGNYQIEDYRHLKARFDRSGKNDKLSVDDFIAAISPSDFLQSNVVDQQQKFRQTNFDTLMHGPERNFIEYVENTHPTHKVIGAEQNQGPVSAVRRNAAQNDESEFNPDRFKFNNEPFRQSKQVWQASLPGNQNQAPQNHRRYLETDMQFDKPLKGSAQPSLYGTNNNSQYNNAFGGTGSQANLSSPYRIPPLQKQPPTNKMAVDQFLYPSAAPPQRVTSELNKNRGGHPQFVTFNQQSELALMSPEKQGYQFTKSVKQNLIDQYVISANQLKDREQQPVQIAGVPTDQQINFDDEDDDAEELQLSTNQYEVPGPSNIRPVPPASNMESLNRLNAASKYHQSQSVQQQSPRQDIRQYMGQGQGQEQPNQNLSQSNISRNAKSKIFDDKNSSAEPIQQSLKIPQNNIRK